MTGERRACASVRFSSLMVVVASAKMAGALGTRIHQPSVFGEILVGLLLGPTRLNVLGWLIFTPTSGPDGVWLMGFVRDLAQSASCY